MFILAEKHGVAKDIADALGGFTRRDGFYDRNGTDCITYARGHLLQPFEPEDYDPRLKKWSLDTLPIIPPEMRYKPVADADARKQLDTIKNLMATYDTTDLVLATDAGREGEFIGALILSHAGFRHGPTARRFWVSQALTGDVIREGIRNARPLSDYERYRQSGYARSRADWLVGMNITRLLSVKSGTLVSFGRVQTAVLGAVYMRDRNISSFKAQPYRQLEIVLDKFSLWLTDGNGGTKLPPNDARLTAAMAKLANGGTATITAVERERKREHPPRLFNLTGLQRHCSDKFKYPPKETLRIAQELYEHHKCLSYPRTPSAVLGDDNVKLFQEKFELLAPLHPELAAGCEKENISPKNKRVFDSASLEDHHALIPLRPLPESATEEQANVYMSVLERFFMAIKPEHEYESVKVTADADGLTLTGTGRNVVRSGWKTTPGDGEEEPCLQPPENGSRHDIKETRLHEKLTQPKKHFTESSILALMENPRNAEDGNGKLASLGTPATRAGIIDTLLKRQYLEMSGRNLTVTDKGRFVIETILSAPELAAFTSLSTTTKWEEKLDRNPSSFAEEITSYISGIMPALLRAEMGQWERASIGTCPLCGGGVLAGKRNWYCGNYKGGCEFVIWRTFMGAAISESDAQALLSGGSTRTKRMTGKSGKEFSARLALDGGSLKIVFQDRKRGHCHEPAV